MGQLVYLPRDQKYRIGPSAVAMSASMMKGAQLRSMIRQRLQEVAEQLPGTVGFVVPSSIVIPRVRCLVVAPLVVCTPITSGIGKMAAEPSWTTSCWCVLIITGCILAVSSPSSGRPTGSPSPTARVGN